ncbi:MAG: glycosyltransferase [bacterium]|nr:glycosyltransferase [bacterium]
MTPPVDLTMLLQGVVPEDQLGYHTAFSNAVDRGALSGYRPFSYRAARSPGHWMTLWNSVVQHMEDTGSNVLYLQYFHHPDIPDPRPFIDRIQALPQRPIVVTSCGDGFGPIGARPPASLTRAASRSDAVFVTSMGRLARLIERAGGRRITLMANSACDVRFANTPVPTEDREFDLVFIGSKPGGRNITKRLFWAGRRRQRLVEHLMRRYGRRFALYGHRWQGNPSWQGPVDFDRQAAVCQKGRVVLGGYPGSTEPYYTSNRPYIQALSGVPIVDFRVPLVEHLLVDGRDWLLFEDLDQAEQIIDALLDGGLNARSIGAAGAETVRKRHLNSHRVGLMISIFTELLEARNKGRDAVCPPLDFIDPASRRASATSTQRCW